MKGNFQKTNIGEILKRTPFKVKKNISNTSIFAYFQHCTVGPSQRNEKKNESYICKY